MNLFVKIATVAGLSFTVGAWAAGGSEKLKADMQAISESYTQLGSQIDDSTKNADSQKLVDTLITKSSNAQKQTPSTAETLKGAEKSKAVGVYKKDMQTMIDHLKGIKVALKANDNSAARRHYDAIKPWTDSSHSEEYK